jgi:hypothetical protein
MPRPRRFTLAALMLLITAVAVVFGYAAWRKRTLLAEVAQLQESTSSIQVSDSWFWPIVEGRVTITWRRDDKGNIFDGETPLSKARYAEMDRRLRYIGVRDVYFGFVNEKEEQGKTILYIETYHSFDDYLGSEAALP